MSSHTFLVSGALLVAAAAAPVAGQIPCLPPHTGSNPFGQAQGYPDPVTLADGSLAFADAVLAFTYGASAPALPGFSNPCAAAGTPDYSAIPGSGHSAQGVTGALALGEGGTLVLAFLDTVLTNSGDATPDLYVFQAGNHPEDSFVSVRPRSAATLEALAAMGSVPDADGFHAAGMARDLGGTFIQPVDLDAAFPGFMPGLLRFDAVKLVDDANGSPVTLTNPGADIDAVAAVGLADPCQGSGPEVVIIDFEGLADGTPVGSQFAERGVVFSIEGSSALPIVAAQGTPVTAFGASDGAMVGTRALTDPVTSSYLQSADIRMTFTLPVSAVVLLLADADGFEEYELRAYAGATLVDSQLVVAGSGGGGSFTTMAVSGSGITSAVLDPSGPSGSTLADFAIDNVAFQHDDGPPLCELAVRVSQESSPGAGDFDDHVLGDVYAFPIDATAAAVYAYDDINADSWGGFLLPLQSRRSQLAVLRSDSGYSLAVVHDRPKDGISGTGDMRVEVVLSGDPDGSLFVLEDDPNDLNFGEPGDDTFVSWGDWMANHTDGFVLGDLEGAFQLDIGYNFPTGIDTWVVLSADNTALPLVLQADRRVRLTLVQDPGWVDVGGGTSGNAGQPILTCAGSLQPSSPLDLELVQAQPSSLALLWISATHSSLPAFGALGMVHAFPPVAQIFLGTDATGSIAGSTLFAGAPPGTQAWFQFICQDPTVVWGLTLSNAVEMTTP